MFILCWTLNVYVTKILNFSYLDNNYQYYKMQKNGHSVDRNHLYSTWLSFTILQSFSKRRLFSIFWCRSKFKIKNCLRMLWTFYTSTISHFPSYEFCKVPGHIGTVTLTVNISLVAGKLPKFNIVKMLISLPYPGGRGPGFQLTSALNSLYTSYR